MTGELEPTMRAADPDRDAVADRLRSAHAEGRLTVEEFHERLDAAFAARTFGDLSGLTADLPPDRAVRPGLGLVLAGLGGGPLGALLLARTVFGGRR